MDKEVYEVRLTNWKQLNLQCHDIDTMRKRECHLVGESPRRFLPFRAV